jgi:maltose/moltooligosaccharide transporter
LVKEFFNNESIYAIIVDGIAMKWVGLLTLKVGIKKQIDKHE